MAYLLTYYANFMTIHQTAVIYPCVIIEEGAYVGPFCVIGCPPEHRGNEGAGAGVLIKAGARLEKFVCVDSGYKSPTVIGKDAMLMNGVHVGHDCEIGEGVTIAPRVNLAGHVKILKGAFLGMGVNVHQHKVIGHYCMIGMGSVITKDPVLWPGTKWYGIPAMKMGKNQRGLTAAAITEDQLNLYEKEFKALCRE